MFVAHTLVIGLRFAFHLDTAKSHANPTVQAPKQVCGVRKVCGEITSGASNDLVELSDEIGIQVMRAFGNLPRLNLEFLH